MSGLFGYDGPMRLPELIAATLLTVAVPGCTPSVSCPDSEGYSVDADLTEDDVADLMAMWDAERGAITCEQACDFAYERDMGDKPDEQSSCVLELDGAVGATPETVVGHVTCTGPSQAVTCEGRRPIGHVELELANAGDLGVHLARCAHLEAASVVAFAQLAERLTAWGAPAALIDRCRQAAAEETRHAQLLTDLAQRAGAEVPPAAQRECEVDLQTAALDNAIEGCVHEAWAAVRAAWIARHAPSPELRRIYAEIAADEAGHAQLAWDLHTWFLSQVDPTQREQLAAARRAAVAALPALASAQAVGAPARLGLPNASTSAALARQFAAGLTAAA